MTREAPEHEGGRDALQDRLDAWWKRNLLRMYLTGFLFLLLIAYFSPRIFITVHTGHRGVMFRRFGDGTVMDRTYPEGFHIIPPWDVMAIYDLRVQERFNTFAVLTKEGLQVEMKLSVRFRPRLDKLTLLHRRIGADYFEKIVLPGIQAELRAFVGDYRAEEIYSTKRDLLEKALERAVLNINESYVVLDDLLIREIRLPPSVAASIESKVREEQAALAYDFKLQREAKEAQRKRIEAEGIRDFQKTIASGISDQLLQWRGIEATLHLAESPNAKVVLLGRSRDGLPLILDLKEGGDRPRSPREAGRAAAVTPPAGLGSFGSFDRLAETGPADGPAGDGAAAGSGAK